MKIYIDVSVLTLATFITGIQRVTREIAIRLIEDGRDDVVLLHYHADEHDYRRIDNRRFVAYYREGKGIKERMITRERVGFGDFEAGSVFFDLDAAWMSRVKRSWLLPRLRQQGVRIVAHIYDIISILYPQYCLERGVYNFMDYIGAHMQYADAIIVNARATADDLGRLAGKLDLALPPCTVVPLGADYADHGASEAPAAQTSDEVHEAADSAPYLLMVGTVEPRKNHKLLLDAYDRGLKEMGYHLIFAGYLGWNMEDFAQRLHAHPDFGTGIFHFEGLPDDAVTYLYRHARFLVFASYIEGFGLPIVESMQRGTPVLAADVPVLREAGGDRCVWFPQDDANALCRCVERYRDDETAYRALVDGLKDYRPAGWEASVRGMREVLAKQTEVR